MLSHLVDVSIRSLLIALVAASMLWLARRGRSAALQHAVWAAVVCGMLALFVFGAYLPRMPLRIPARATLLPAAPNVASTDLPTPPEESTSAPAHSASPTPRAIDWNEVALASYVAIALIFLIRFVFGIFLAQRLMMRSSRSGRFYESALISVPVTVGCVRPRIILPLAWREWDSEKLTAVLTHEDAHVRRHDGLIAAAAHVNRCIFWFHPLAWILESRLALLAEQACDELCVATLGDRERYARLLLAMANAADASHGRLRYHALTMAASSHIGKRIEALLDEGRTFSRGLSWAGWTVVMLSAIPIVLGAGSVHLLMAQASPAPPGPVRVSLPTFEVASIRPAAIPAFAGEGAGRSGGSGAANCGAQRITMDESLVHYRCVPLKGLIEFAFGIPERPGLITGPDWMMDISPGQRFDIEAKLPQGAAKTQVPEMLQALLRDRFKLIIHRGTTEQPVNAIVVDKSGLKLKDASPNAPEPIPDPAAPPCVPERLCAAIIRNSNGEEVVLQRVARGIDKFSSPSLGTALVTNSPQGTRIEAPSSTMAGLAILLGPMSLLNAVDMTGLTGRYQIMLETSLDRNALLRPFMEAAQAAAAAGGPDNPAANAEFAAAQQKSEADMAAAELKAWQVALLKVGLRLEQRKASSETLIVDHAERMPTEN